MEFTLISNVKLTVDDMGFTEYRGQKIEVSKYKPWKGEHAYLIHADFASALNLARDLCLSASYPDVFAGEEYPFKSTVPVCRSGRN